MATIYPFMTGSYAREVYLYGNRSFPSIKPEYVQPVKQYAAATYSYDQVDNALGRSWITAAEHGDTTALMPPRPAPLEPEPTPQPPAPTEPEPPVVIPPAETVPSADPAPPSNSEQPVDGGEEAV
ncbi:hypothetical protein HGI30_15870 [Paenibacillus albicereus]|uniref:Uncharacterized protein n=1 Tax=Paenibacillus albicereus TaxID=2726185 RepID=A0A6H2GZS3_9BACL|nr:hypothetical protein [Paenibacillus albicereus]QJC52897.1 hypothetical protein HGI30_15870 [Paenibacillus albicereus]